MSRNEGTLDRVIRGAIGVALAALVLVARIDSPPLYWGAIVAAAILLITAATGFCPAYRLLGLRTCRAC